ncbi:hypothetical protein P376_3356 [Streptomyces sp. HCCB10043]|nr:hypothetical protein P376_3356 [Streptomyces sp. HCCB10043]
MQGVAPGTGGPVRLAAGLRLRGGHYGSPRPPPAPYLCVPLGTSSRTRPGILELSGDANTYLRHASLS